jgi:hypothetical protein
MRGYPHGGCKRLTWLVRRVSRPLRDQIGPSAKKTHLLCGTAWVSVLIPEWYSGSGPGLSRPERVWR